MALILPEFPDPRDPAHPVANAYAWLSSLALDLRSNNGRFTLSIHPRAEAWQGQPIGVISIALGSGGVPTLDHLLTTDPEFAAAYETLGAKLYQVAAAGSPLLAGAVPE